MGSTKHRDRMRGIRRFVIPPKESAVYKQLDDIIAHNLKNPEYSKKAKKAFRTAHTRVSAQLENGAGFQMDQLIRSFLLEYNDRNMRHGLLSLPASFNVLEAFTEYDPNFNVFKLRKEIDHLFSFTDFLDYVTSPNVADDVHEALNYMEDGVIYSYDIINNPSDFTLRLKDGSEYVTGGVSIIKHRNEVSLITLAGEQVNLKEKSEEIIENFNVIKTLPGREDLTPADCYKLEAVPMFSGTEYWKVMVLTRFDFDDMTQNVRYLLRDIGTSYEIITDDISTLFDTKGRFLISEGEEIARKMYEYLEEYSALFELCKIALYLPLYFENNIDSIVEERHPTCFGDNVKKKKWLLKNKYLTPHERVSYRTISVLRKEDPHKPATSFLMAPEIKLEISGYWKKLPIDQVGTDKHGNPIHGRTWVEKRLTWVESDLSSESIHIKYKQLETVKGANAGRIYVMRSAAHAKDIFKIGLTHRSSLERAEELSRTSGSPDKFLVVQEWNVSDCVVAEKMIHQALEKYRINPKREFFKAPYNVIVKSIEDIILHIGA